jgi:protein-tyrosine phosphatase
MNLFHYKIYDSRPENGFWLSISPKILIASIRFNHILFAYILNAIPASEIVPNLFIGNFSDAKKVDAYDKIICVLEHPTQTAKNVTWIRLLRGERADMKQLDKIANTIDYNLKNDKKVLVHCGAGIERSPLAVVWYLHTRKHMPIDTAYKLVRTRRIIAQDRRLWIPETECLNGKCEHLKKEQITNNTILKN